MNIEEMREEFEDWMINKAKIIVGSSDPYPAGLERDYWRVWQASRAAIEVLLPHGSVYPAGEAASEADYYFDQGQADGLRKARNAIESLGLKVKP